MFVFLRNVRARKAAREAAAADIAPASRNQRVFDRTPMAADLEVPKPPTETRRDVFGQKLERD